MISDMIYYSNIVTEHCSSIPLFAIEYYELTLVLKGTMTYYADGKKIVLKRDDAVFLKPGTLRSRDRSSGPVHYISFNFRLSPDVTVALCEHIKSAVNDDIRKLISVFHYKHLDDKFHTKEKCCSILNYILLEIIDMQELKSNNEYVTKIFHYVAEHLNEKISLKDVAKHVHLSKEYTAYIFKKETGMTFSTYINEQKITLSKKLIVNENMTLNEISVHLNFVNYDYFSKTFKRYTGISPSEYRSISMVNKTQ